MKKMMRKGQTMVEYVLIISLIAVALIGTFTLIKNKIADKGEEIGEALDEAGN